ncbi:hypothetical protein F2P81_015317 [Scophthalmus maximus]|uniref:Secreted protein n=1 Tax=Scophthalmus maximus TaxID=52904 RepID=A0A6A4SIF2_SCOMX|nr:hypothetical protein F2P81_015317 [Scophthalmus maximus]
MSVGLVVLLSSFVADAGPPGAGCRILLVVVGPFRCVHGLSDKTARYASERGGVTFFYVKYYSSVLNDSCTLFNM